VALPEKDRPILEAAIRCKATHLLTGDRKHFGRFMNRPEVTSGVIIQTVAEFLE
jgi:predicted nucleic acid-binding protein